MNIYLSGNLLVTSKTVNDTLYYRSIMSYKGCRKVVGHFCHSWKKTEAQREQHLLNTVHHWTSSKMRFHRNNDQRLLEQMKTSSQEPSGDPGARCLVPPWQALHPLLDFSTCCWFFCSPSGRRGLVQKPVRGLLAASSGLLWSSLLLSRDLKTWLSQRSVTS